MLQLRIVVLWIHVLCMVGTFGGLLLAQFGLPARVRDSAEVGPRLGRLPSILLGLGFIAGMVLYVILMRFAASGGGHLPPRTHMLIGIKFILLLAAGALMGMTGKFARTERHGVAGQMRVGALLCLAAAAFLGVIL